MNKEERQRIFEMFGGKCAYCGKELNGRWHVDHIIPIYRNDTDEQFERRIKHGSRRMDIPRGKDVPENYYPSCSRCNGWKSTFTIESFRAEISEQAKRARAYSCNFRMAEDFGLIKETGIEVKFYFETQPKPQ